MERTTISLPPDLHERLRLMAAERGVSVASLIREAIEEKIGKRRKVKRKFHSLGMFDSGYTDTARLAGEFRYEPPSWR